MAARRLLIVMLVLLGLSTLAAALVPQRTLRRETSTAATTTQPTPTAPTGPLPSPLPPRAKITVGGNKFPVIPAHVGVQFTLLARSRFPTQLEIPEFGLVAFATPETPARFDLLAGSAGTFGVLFVPPHRIGGCLQRVAARIEIVPPGKKPKQVLAAKCAARGGSGQP